MVEPNDPDAQKQIQHLRNEIAKLRDENASLRSKFVSLPPDLEQADESKLKTSLLRAQRDLVGKFLTLLPLGDAAVILN